MSKTEQKFESWDKPTGYPSVATLNRRAAEKKDVGENRRYFQNLIVKLDGEIGEQKQTFNELMQAGELVDPEGPQLHIERMEMLRVHAARLLDQLGREESGHPVSAVTSTGVPGATLVRTEEPATKEPGDPLLTVKELAKLIKKSTSWIYKESMKDTIPRYKIGGELRFKMSEVEAWFEAKPGELLKGRGRKA